MVGTTDSFAGMAWRDRVIHPDDGMIARQFAWFGKLVDGGTSRDGLIFVFSNGRHLLALGLHSGLVYLPFSACVAGDFAMGWCCSAWFIIMPGHGRYPIIWVFTPC
ncbi:MAG: hypothetical protein HC804_03610 [Anaerolineae bacterium]|nr:hypothetical protein [Anaerolineae bacterium]